MGEDMRRVVGTMAAGQHPDLSGASGNLDFDKDVYTSVLESTYANFMVYGGRYVTLGYNKSNGSRRSNATLAGWNWKNTQMQEFGDDAEVSYPALKDQWALLVAGLVGWENYRHQADVLSVYRMLRERGYPDVRTQVDLKASAELGTMIYANVRLYGCAGPEINLGPKVNAEASARLVSAAEGNSGKNYLTGNYKMGVSMGGSVDAIIKIWKWELKRWSSPFTIWNGPSKEDSFRIDF